MAPHLRNTEGAMTTCVQTRPPFQEPWSDSNRLPTAKRPVTEGQATGTKKIICLEML